MLISEHFRLAANDWVDKENAANVLEETKSSVLSQRMVALGDIPVSRAELIVKSSAEWFEHVEKIAAARAEANRAKMKLEFIRMRFSEWQSREANARAERKL